MDKIKTIELFVKYRQVADYESIAKAIVRFIIGIAVMFVALLTLENLLVIILWMIYIVCITRILVVTFRKRKKDPIYISGGIEFPAGGQN